MTNPVSESLKDWQEEYYKLHDRLSDEEIIPRQKRIWELEAEVEERRMSTPTMNAVHMLQCKVRKLEARILELEGKNE
jgi:hypothetical protein